MNLVLNEVIQLLTKLQRFDAASALKLFEGGAISEEDCRDTLLGIQTQLSNTNNNQEEKGRKFYYLEFSGGSHLISLNEIRTAEKISQWNDRLEDEVFGLILNRNFPTNFNVRDLFVWYGTEIERDEAYVALISWMTTLGPVEIKEVTPSTITLI